MVPVLPLLVGYIFWQHGWKAAVLSTAAAAGTVAFWHALYWPEILQVWARLPRTWTSILNVWRLPVGYQTNWKPVVSSQDRIASFFQTIQYNFAVMIGVLASIVLWPGKGRWKSKADYRSAVFLLILFVLLFWAHMSEALGKSYCVYCLAGYVTFFSVTGLLLVVLTAPIWRQLLPVWLQGIIATLIIVISAGIGFGAFERIGNLLYNLSVPQWLLGSSTPGSAALGAILVNKFSLEATDLRRLLPIVFGALAGALVLLLALLVKFLADHRAMKRETGGAPASPGNPPVTTPQARKARPSYGYWAMLTFLVAGTLLAPTIILGGGYTTYDCSDDVLASYEAAGKHLAENIPPGSRVYWNGQLSTVPLLYVPGIRIYPAQINGDYSFLRSGSDLEVITRLGRWNQDLANQWASEADYVLIEQRKFRGWLRDLMLAGGYEELTPTPPAVNCRDGSVIRIFKRLQ
jgi:hypothetical protein